MSTLPRTISRPDGSLLLLEIDVDPSKAAPMTAVFSPPNYKPGGTVDLIVYFHGQHIEASGTFVSKMTIEDYFKHADFSPLLTNVKDACTGTNPRNLLLVAPTLNPSAEAGALATKGMDWYLGEVLDGCLKHGPHQGRSAVPTVKNLILACHSGGGKVMLEAAEQAAGTRTPGGNKQGFGSALQECWGFDCLYDAVPVVDLDPFLKPALNGKMTAAQATKAGLDPWKSGKGLDPSGCETHWRDFARGTTTPVFMHWFERMIRNRNLDLIVKWPPAVVPAVNVFPNFYDGRPANLPVPVKKQAHNAPTSHNAVPRSFFPTRLAAMKLV
jgi:hypothetical protein